MSFLADGNPIDMEKVEWVNSFSDRYHGYVGVIPADTSVITIVPPGADYQPTYYTKMGYIADGEYHVTDLPIRTNDDYSEGWFAIPEGATSISLFGEIFQ